MDEMHTLIKLLGSTVFAQFLVICISPILTRLYSPQVFGEFLVLISIAYIVNSIALARMDVAILSMKKENYLAQAFSLGLLFSLSVSLITFVLAIIVNYFFDTSNNFLFISLIVFSLSIYQLIVALLIRKGNISFVARNKINQSLILGFGQVSLGVYSPGLLALVIAQVLSFSSAILLNISNFKKYLRKINLKINIARFKKYIIYDNLGNFFQVFSANIFPLLIGMVLGGYVAGLYYMAYRVVITPISIFSVSISQTIASKHPLSNNLIQWKNLNRNALTVMTLFFFIPFAIGSAYVEVLIPIILGSGWSEAGTLIKFFSTWMFLRLIYDSFIINLSLNNLSNVKMKIDLMVIILNSVVFFCLWVLDLEGITFLKFFAYANSLVYFIALLYFCHKFDLASKKIYSLILFCSLFVFIYPMFYSALKSILLAMVFLLLVIYLYKLKDKIF